MFERNVWRFDNRIDKVGKVLLNIQSVGTIEQAVRGELRRPFWTPKKKSASPETNSHIESLQIPLADNEPLPLVLLYKIGSFQHDPNLRKRLDHIFNDDKHTCVRGCCCRNTFLCLAIPIDFLLTSLVLGKPDSFTKAFVYTGAFISPAPTTAWLLSVLLISRPFFGI